MNREILFRVWNGQEMIYNVVVGKFGVCYVNPGSKGDGLDENDNASLTPYNTKYPDGLRVMQFTGLTDKNGEKIFEDDIVKVKEIFLGKPIDPSFLMRVVYSVSVCAYQLRHIYLDNVFKNDHLDFTDSIEVIGNIHENIELLNQCAI